MNGRLLREGDDPVLVPAAVLVDGKAQVFLGEVEIQGRRELAPGGLRLVEQALGPRDRLVYALRHLERMTVEEIAASMELSASTVKRALAHATTKMSRWLESDLGLVGLLDGKEGNA